MRTFDVKIGLLVFLILLILLMAAVACLLGGGTLLNPVAGQAVHSAVSDSKSKEEREKEVRKLIAVLQSDALPYDKDVACRRLAVIGTKEAVAALAGLLSDEKLCDIARLGLEPIPDPSVDEALRSAMKMKRLKGRQLIGVINSIGNRRDKKAVTDLVKLLKDPDMDVAGAAANALGKIGCSNSAKALGQALGSAPAGLRPAVAEGCLWCAQSLAAQGKRKEALALYDGLRRADLPKHIVAAATRGAILVRGSAGVPLLLEQLKSDNKELFGIALRLAREMPGTALTKALVAQLANLPPDKRILLLQALGDRGDAAALLAIVGAAKRGDSAVRVAALRVLGQIGNASVVSVVPVLFDAAVDPDAQVARAAQATLVGLPGEQVDAAILAMLEKGIAKTRRVAIDAVAKRQILAANQALLKASDDPDAEVRASAIRALAETGGEDDLAGLVKVLLTRKDEQELTLAETAIEAVYERVSDKQVFAEKLLSALPQAEGASKCALLWLLHMVGGADALKAVRASVKDANAEIQDAAIRSLSEWLTDDAAPELAEIVRTSLNPAHKVMALRGYVRLASLAGGRSTQETVRMYTEAMSMAQRPEEKKVVLSRLADFPHQETLKIAQACLDDNAVKAEAEVAVLKIAWGLAGSSREDAEAALKKLATSSQNEAIRKQAHAAIRQLEKFEDYITAWQVSGPYEQAGAGFTQLFDIAFAPEKPDAKGVQWRMLPAGTNPARPFMLDLRNACGGEQRVAYVRTWVHSEQEQQVQLDFGTDDGNKVWLNGKLVHANPAGGAAVPSEHKVKAVLQKGWNFLMLKVTQDTGPWEFCLRIRKPDGSKLERLKVQALSPE